MRKVYELEIDELEEISGVDRPAQPGARAVIFKRATTPSTPNTDSATLPVAKNASGAAGENQEPTNMTDTKDPAAELAAIQKKLSDQSVELEIAKALGSFSDAEKAIYKALDAVGQEAFRKLSPEQRVEKVRTAGEVNPVVYTSSEGETFRKNDDPRMVAMAKRADEISKNLAAERAIRASENFKKRAGEELKNLPGDEIVKVELLRAVDGISDPAVRTSVAAILKAGNDAMTKSFRPVGTATGAPDTSAEAAHEKLETIAKGLREKDSKLDEVNAYAKACELHPELYEQAVGSTVGEES